MSNDKPTATMRDPKTLKMQYAVGLTEEDARRLKSLLEAKNFEAMQEEQGAEPWSDIIAKLNWVLETAASDKKPDAVP